MSKPIHPHNVKELYFLYGHGPPSLKGWISSGGIAGRGLLMYRCTISATLNPAFFNISFDMLMVVMQYPSRSSSGTLHPSQLI